MSAIVVPVRAVVEDIMILTLFLGCWSGVEEFAEVKRNERTRTFKRSANQKLEARSGSDLGPWTSSRPLASLVG